MIQTGRIKAPATVHREIRRVLNSHAAQLAEKTLAKALQGDSEALSTAAQLLLAANNQPSK